MEAMQRQGEHIAVDVEPASVPAGIHFRQQQQAIKAAQRLRQRLQIPIVR